MPHGGEGANGGHTTPIFDHSGKDKNWDGWGKNGNPDRPPRKGRVWQRRSGDWYETRFLTTKDGTMSDFTVFDYMNGVDRNNRWNKDDSVVGGYSNDPSVLEEIAEDIQEKSKYSFKGDPIKLRYGTLYNGFKTDANNSLRYPTQPSILTEESDYVAFRFYKYAPPFKNRKKDSAREPGDPAIGKLDPAKMQASYDYNQSGFNGDAAYERLPGDAGRDILLYMPEDVSTGYKANWQGKAFSNIGADLLRSVGNGKQMLTNFSEGAKDTLERGPAVLGAIAISRLIGSITGDAITADDIFSSTSGAILNPNVELLFGGVDLRNFSLTYKLVPRNDTETVIINDIVKRFKRAMLPTTSPGSILGINSNGDNQGVNNGFIGLPDLCQVVFMQGSGMHPVLPKFKMCAITDVSVNYTPDGSYATYGDGQPVAIELGLTFQETKMVFQEDIEQGF